MVVLANVLIHIPDIKNYRRDSKTTQQRMNTHINQENQEVPATLADLGLAFKASLQEVATGIYAQIEATSRREVSSRSISVADREECSQ